MAPAMKQHQESLKEDVLETTVVKAQKLVEHEGCSHTRDYDNMTQEFMMTAIREYHACLCTKAPMPDHIVEMSLLDASWVQAHKATGVNLDRTLQLAKIVTSRGLQHMSADEDGQRGFLKVPLIQKIINTMWFTNKHNDSIRFHKHFKPFPYPALTLVLTVEYCGTYNSHLKCLQVFEEAMKTHNVLQAICMRLYEVGCIHSGTAPFSTLTEVTVSA
ncbi:hypothetical protein F5141DRAFT_1064351 [Pisolithus sp. B1]|nr:hypothetical protein F5141DRAFT_1064351 [Pisolithus sp. B1]